MRYIFTLILLLTTCLGWAQMSTEAPVITILHTNDTHSQIEPAKTKQTDVAYGGVAERAALIEYFRQKEPDLLYFDAGDMVQGSPYFNVFKGELEMLCMNQQRLVASTFGNHEFDNGIEGIAFMLQYAQFPLVSCNYHCEATDIGPLIVPHLILENHGVKIGVTGVTCDPEGLITARNWEGIRYEDPRTAVNREAALLRQEGCDLVVVLSHVGYLSTHGREDELLDNDLASASHDIDLIIGAHTHVNIENGVKVDNAEGKPVYITQTGGKANPIGHVRIRMKAGSTYPGCQYSVDTITCHKLHPENYDLSGIETGIEEILKPYRDALAEQMNVRIAHAPKLLGRGHPQCTLGNYTTDALLRIGEKYSGQHIDASIMNMGGLRSDLPEGDVTIGSIYNIFPFENAIVILDLTGEQLQQLINSNAGRGLDNWGGTQITQAKDGDRVYAAKALVGGQPIDPKRIYHICTIDYLAEGNGGMTILTQAQALQKTGVTIRDAMIEYIKEADKMGLPVAAELDSRVIDQTK